MVRIVSVVHLEFTFRSDELRMSAVDSGIVKALVAAIGSGDTHILVSALHALSKLGASGAN